MYNLLFLSSGVMELLGGADANIPAFVSNHFVRCSFSGSPFIILQTILHFTVVCLVAMPLLEFTLL